MKYIKVSEFLLMCKEEVGSGGVCDQAFSCPTKFFRHYLNTHLMKKVDNMYQTYPDIEKRNNLMFVYKLIPLAERMKSKKNK